MAVNLSPINSCEGSGKLCNFWELQINNEYQTLNNIWFKVEEDLSLSDGGQINLEVDTEDGTTSQAGRQSDSVNGFKQTVDFTFKDGSAYAFNQEMSAVFSSGDEYLKDFLECGMNVRKTICYPNGTKQTKTYVGATTTSATEPLTAIQNADAEWDISLTLPEPTISAIGNIGALPKSVTEPTITTSYVLDVENDQATFSATIVSDEDNVIVPTTPTGEEIRVDVYDKDDNYLSFAYVDNQFTFPVAIESGDNITLAWSFHLFDDSTGQRIYYTFKTENITIE